MFIKNLLNLTTDAFIIVNSETTIETANAAALTLMGYQEEELVGQKASWLFDCNINGHLSIELTSDVSCHVRAADGRHIPATYSSIPMTDDDGNVQSIIYLIRRANSMPNNGHLSVSEVAETILNTHLCDGNSDDGNAQSELTRTDVRYQRMFDYSPVMMHRVDRDGTMIEVNKQWLTKLGYERDEVLGKHAFDFMTEKSRKYALEVVLPELRAKGIVRNVPYTYLTHNGSEVNVLLTGTVHYDGQGVLQDSLAIAIEINDRDQAEVELEKRIDEVNRIYQTSANLLGTVNVEGYFVSLNPAWEQVLGYSIDELQASPYIEFIHPDDIEVTIDAAGKMAEVAEDFEAVQFENRYQHKDGSYRWLSWYARPKADEGLIYFAAYDITERKRTEEELGHLVTELQKRTDEALESSRLKSDFLATMSHELRTPLNSTIGFGGILLEGMAGQMDDMARSMVQNMYDSSQHLLSLINDILDIAKIEAGRFDLVEGPFEVRDLATKWKNQMLVQAKAKGVKFEVSAAAAVPQQLVGDTERITQISHNLLANAFKFTHAGSVHLHMDWQDDHFIIRVSDTGIGIAPHALGYIFDEFRQVDSSSQRVYGGTGLGLAIVRKICVAMGGEINVISTLGEGSAFTAKLPLKQFDHRTHA